MRRGRVRGGRGRRAGGDGGLAARLAAGPPSAHVVLAAALTETGTWTARAAGRAGGGPGRRRRRVPAGAPGRPCELHLARRRPGGARRLPRLRAATGRRRGAEPLGARVALRRGPGAGGARTTWGGPPPRRRGADLARAFGAPGAVGRALRTIGALEAGKRAVEPLEAAVACLEESQTALERARALVDLGCTLRRVHRSRDAREPLRRGSTWPSAAARPSSRAGRCAR